jgi:hypothetical protein
VRFTATLFYVDGLRAKEPRELHGVHASLAKSLAMSLVLTQETADGPDVRLSQPVFVLRESVLRRFDDGESDWWGCEMTDDGRFVCQFVRLTPEP